MITPASATISPQSGNEAGKQDEKGLGLMAHTFQTPRVVPLHSRDRSPELVLRVTARDAERIVRALQQASLDLCETPSGAHLSGNYRTLAARVRGQAEAWCKATSGSSVTPPLAI
jgi:hypothetical protein